MMLKDMKPGESGTIVKINTSAGAQRLFDLGFFPGTKISVVRNAPLKDPMECSVDGRRVTVRRCEVEGVEVAPE